MYSSTDEKFGTSRRKVAQRSLQRNMDRGKARIFQPENFNLQDFPLDITTQILVLATATSGYWRTYQSLVAVSHAMRELVYDACLPYLPVMLHTKKHVDSFCMLLESHPTVVGRRIRSLWFIAGVKADVERKAGLNILRVCTGITHLACRINLLSTLVSQSGGVVHRQLNHLTLVETIVPWELLLTQAAGRQLFAQLTHLRVSGGTEFVKPDFCFAKLSHLSFTCHDLSSLTAKPTSISPSLSPSAAASQFPAAQFPVLEQIVPSIPYKSWRSNDPKRIRTVGLEMDNRMGALACPKKWKEADVWENARRGGNDLWAYALAVEYLQKNTLKPRHTHRIVDHESDYFDDFGWDSEEYGPFGGETGL